MKTLLVALFIFTQISPAKAASNDLLRTYEATFSIDAHRGARMADDLYSYLKEPCSKTNQPGCGFVSTFESYKALTAKLNRSFGLDWEGPEGWNDFTLRSTYWNLAPFSDLTPDQASMLQTDMVRWLLARQTLANSLSEINPLLERLSGQRGARATKVIAPAVRAYFAGLSPASRRLHVYGQVHCQENQALCQKFKSEGLKSLNATLGSYGPQAIHLRDRLGNDKSEIQSDLHLSLSRVMKLDELFQQLEKGSTQDLLAFQRNQPASAAFQNALDRYLEALSREVALPKNFTNLPRMKIWSQAIELNDLIKTYQMSFQMAQGQAGAVDRSLLQEIDQLFTDLENFLKNQSMDAERTFQLPTQELTQ